MHYRMSMYVWVRGSKALKKLHKYHRDILDPPSFSPWGGGSDSRMTPTTTCKRELDNYMGFEVE